MRCFSRDCSYTTKQANRRVVSVVQLCFLSCDQASTVNVMSLEDRIKATAKNVECKIQETVGNVTGDPKDQAEGKSKQVEAQARHTVEDMKDKAKEIID